MAFDLRDLNPQRSYAVDQCIKTIDQGPVPQQRIVIQDGRKDCLVNLPKKVHQEARCPLGDWKLSPAEEALGAPNSSKIHIDGDGTAAFDLALDIAERVRLPGATPPK